MDYADIREAIYDHLVAQVGAVSGRVFQGWVASPETEKPYLIFYFTGELPSINTPCGTFMQYEVLVVGEEGTSMRDFVIYLKSELYDICYLQQNAFDKEDAYCSLERQIELFSLLQEIFTIQVVLEYQ